MRGGRGLAGSSHRWLFCSLLSGLIIALISVGAFSVAVIDTFDTEGPSSSGEVVYDSPEGMRYTGSGGDGATTAWSAAVADGGTRALDILSGTWNETTTEKMTITSQDGEAFDFVSLYYNVGPSATATATIRGYGPEPFITSYSPGVNGTYTPPGGNKLVTRIEITSLDFFNDFLDTVTVNLDVPGPVIYGNSQLIVNGDATPSVTDDTDFGTTDVGTPVTKDFTIENEGDALLSISGSVTVTGTGFSVTAQPSSTIAPDADSTLTIQFSPAGAGSVTGTVTVTNNSEASPYTFNVTGEGTGAPEIDVQRPEGAGNSIADPGTDAQGSIAATSGTQITLTYTVENTGNAPLTVSNITSTAASNVAVILITPTTLSVPASGGRRGFTLKYAPMGSGAFSFELDIANNDNPGDGDSEENYDITVSGTTTGPEINVERPALTTIANGGTDAQGWKKAGTQETVTYAVRNTGTALLTVTNVRWMTASNVSVGTITPRSFGLGVGGVRSIEVPYTPASDGAFSFELEVVSDALNEAYYDIIVSGTGDGTPPVTTAGAGPSDPNNDSDPTFAFTATDTGGSGVASSSATLSGTLSAGPVVVTSGFALSDVLGRALATNGTEDGAYTMSVVSTDNVGNVETTATWDWTYDLQPPAKPGTPDMDAGSDLGELDDDDVTNDDTPTFSGGAGSVEGSATVEIRSSVAGALDTFMANADGSWTYTVLPGSPLAEGSHDITIRAIDAAGNIGDYSDSLAVLIDTTPPSVPAGLDPADGIYTNDEPVTLSWSASSDPGGSGLRVTDTYRYVVDGGSSGYTANTQYEPTLSEGSYVWRVRSRDIAGNNSAYTSDSDLHIDVTDAVDPTPSSSSHTVGVLSSDATVDIEIAGESDPLSNGVTSGVDGFDVAFDKSPTWTATETLDEQEGWTGGTFTADSDGDWYFHIATRDNAGNWTSTEHFGPLDIDTTDPDVSSVTPSDTLVADNDVPGAFTVVVVFSEDMLTDGSADPALIFDPAVATGGTPTLTNESGSWNGTTGTYTFTYDLADNGQDEDSVTIDVTGAKDAAGNPQTDYTPEVEFAVDTENPTATIWLDDTLITDADVGTWHYAYVSFSEDMDTTLGQPARSFDPNVTTQGGGTGTLAHTTPTGWTSSTTFRRNYFVFDTDDPYKTVDMLLNGNAQDLAGNPFVPSPTTNVAAFIVDTENPTVTSVVAAPVRIAETDVGVGAFTLTITFDEAMDTGVKLTVDFPAVGEDPASTIIFDSGSTWTNSTTFVARYEVVDANEEIDDIDVRVTGGKDSQGNAQVQYDEADVFDIDTVKPSVSLVAGVSVDTDPITEADLIQVVTVTFDEAMLDDGTADPAITFSAGSWVSAGGAYDGADTVWTEAFTLTDNEEEVTGVTIDVAGAKDASGNPQEDYTPEAEFDIDVNKPSVSSISGVSVDTDPVYEGDMTQVVTVTFDEAMLDNGSANPSITFSAGTWNSAGDGAYDVTDTIWTETFTVVDNDEEVDDVTIDVTGARDAVGNPQEDYTPEAEFDLDTRKPIPGVTVDHTTIALAYGVPASNPIYENSLTLTVTVVYDEDMNTATEPTITLVDETAARWTGPLGGTWGGTTDTYTATFAHDGVDDEVAGVYAQVAAAGGAEDVPGNDEEPDTSPTFDVDTRKPTISLIEVEENGYCGYGCYGSAGSLPLERREFDVTIDFSESVWQPGGDTLVLTFDLDSADDPLVANNNTLTFTGIAPDATSAAAVWTMQDEVETNTVEDGDNSCDLAVTSITMTGSLYDAAGNAFVIPALDSTTNVKDRQAIIVDTVAPSAVDDPEAVISYDYVQPRFLAYQEIIEGVRRIVLREDTEIYIDVLTNDPDNCDASKHLLGTSDWVTLPKYGVVSLFTGYPTPVPAAGCNATVVRYIPPHDYTGPDDFTYRMRDCSDNQASARVDLYVFSKNVVANTYYTTFEGMPLPITLETTDELLLRIADHWTFRYTFELLNGPEHGVLIGDLSSVLYDDALGISYVNLTYMPTGPAGARDLIEWTVTDPFDAVQEAFVDIEIMSREGATTDVAPVFEIPLGALIHVVPPDGFFLGAGVLGLRIETLGILGEVVDVIEGDAVVDVITVLGDPSGVQYLEINTEALASGVHRLVILYGGGEIVVPFEVKEVVE